MKPNIYERDGNYYHGECAVGVVLDTLEEDPRTEPWVRRFEFTNPESDLDYIAEYMGIDRDNEEQVKAARFPVPVEKVPDPPSLCSACLNFFKRNGDRAESSDV